MDLISVAIMVAIIAVFGVLLSNPRFVQIISWLAISAMVCFIAWFSFEAPEIDFLNALLGSLIFTACSVGSFLLATKIMPSLWTDMMFEGVIRQGKPIFVAKFWTGLWSFLIPLVAAAIIGGIGVNVYYSKVVGYESFFVKKEAKSIEDNNKLGDAEEKSVSIVKAESLNMRSNPGATNSVVSKLSKGQQIVLLSDSTTTVGGAKWARIKAGDVEGWVDTKFLADR